MQGLVAIAEALVLSAFLFRLFFHLIDLTEIQLEPGDVGPEQKPLLWSRPGWGACPFALLNHPLKRAPSVGSISADGVHVKHRVKASLPIVNVDDFGRGYRAGRIPA